MSRASSFINSTGIPRLAISGRAGRVARRELAACGRSGPPPGICSPIIGWRRTTPPPVAICFATPLGRIEAGFWWGELLRPASGGCFSLTYEFRRAEEELAILDRRASACRSPRMRPSRLVRAALGRRPDGQVTLVTGAGINGAQRRSMAEPEDAEARRGLRDLSELATSLPGFSRGSSHSRRVSNALWPMNWPTLIRMTILFVLAAGPRAIILPRVPLCTSAGTARRRGARSKRL